MMAGVAKDAESNHVFFFTMPLTATLTPHNMPGVAKDGGGGRVLRTCRGAVRDHQERARVGEGVRRGGQVQEGGVAGHCRRRLRKGTHVYGVVGGLAEIFRRCFLPWREKRRLLAVALRNRSDSLGFTQR